MEGRGGKAPAAGGAVRGGTRTLTWAPLTTSPAMAEGGRDGAPQTAAARGWAGARAAASSRQSADAGGSATGPREGAVAEPGSAGT